MQQMVVCPKCGAQNADNSQYCLSCGIILNNNCFNCGAVLDSTARFCSTCGSGVGWALKIKDLQIDLNNINLDLESSYNIWTEINSKLEQIDETNNLPTGND